ncbi:MAG: hypothetical protein KDB27_14005 [Planctomycetales bacterium]|nr:hypothetical protein [Planctomycetales bacterium]
MAIYIKISKISEDSAYATYEFGPNEQRVGQIRVTKDTGEMIVLSEVPGDEKNAYAPPAQRKLLVHWRKGEFPDTTCWAS